MQNKPFVVTALVIIFVLGIFVLFGDKIKKGNVQNAPKPTASSQKPPDSPNFSIVLKEQNNSGEAGIASIQRKNSKTLVVISLVDQPQTSSQPAHLHAGTCEKPGRIGYTLNNVVDGKSETILDVGMDDFYKKLPLILNIHKSEKEINTYVSCGMLSNK